VRLGVKLLVEVRVSDADAVDESEGVCVADQLADTLAVSLRVCNDEGVPVREPEALAVAERELLGENVPVWLAADEGLRL